MRRTRAPLAVIVAILAALFVLWNKRAEPPAPLPAPAPATTRATPSSTTSAPSRAESRTASSGSVLERLSEEEREAVAATIARIENGGPFLHQKDGTVFGNRERRLPARPKGYYREYTVETPGASTRGARRIVRGTEGDTWYTHDHYETFVRIDE